MTEFERATSCGCSDNECSSGAIERRQFIKLAGLGAASVGAGQLPVMAGPFEENEYLATIPIDKKLAPTWVKSLYDRGEKQTYSDAKALAHIGMPVGGFFAGTVYLGGDGRLWLWDIFNGDPAGIVPREAGPISGIGRAPKYLSGLNYLTPAPFTQPFDLGFSVEVGGEKRSLDSAGFKDVSFDGRYPIGRVTYRDDASPVEVQLEAFSPFIPLSVEDSSLPATVMSYRVKNTSDKAVDVQLSGRMQNAVCVETKAKLSGKLRNRIVREKAMTALVCSAEAPGGSKTDKRRADIVFDDFERATYDRWKAEGKAFGAGPVGKKDVPAYQGDLGGKGSRVVNSHATAPGTSVKEKDDVLGTLTSDAFTIERRFIQFLVGGGAHKGKTCVNLLVDGKVVATVTGRSDNRMLPTAMDVGKFEGKKARLQVVDQAGEPWCNIGIDHIVFTDKPLVDESIVEQRDYGTMTLTMLGASDGAATAADISSDKLAESETSELAAKLTGRIGRTLRLEPGEEQTVDFVVTWHFPNFYAHQQWFRGQKLGQWYAAKFDSALAVAKYVSKNFARLAGDTRNWVETWYDSSLPYWLLDRTMANTSTLATTTCYRHRDGRYWAWEGVGCCPGTCTHVWHYAQAVGRLFPAAERDQRERIDFGSAFGKNGAIHYRAEVHNHHADDGQCGRILGVLREHQMSASDDFLKRLWPKVKQAVEFMIVRDGDADGILGGAQPNTLDAAWFGKISFTSSLYLAALRAGEVMAREMGDDAFADKCAKIAKAGAKNILELNNGEYFIQIEDPKHKDKIGVGPGCYIDQVFGQAWSHWVGTGMLFDRDKQLAALRALWKYNFVPDVGPFRKKFKPGRWYAAAGDAGLLMCTWPKGGKNPTFKKHWQYMYFNECMSGFEWQVAAHMIWEGHDQPDLLEKGLAISRAIHDRYDASLRNPYNEVECSDHYARAMASYGVFQAVCGFQCHGPKGHIEFAPRLTPEKFKAAFTSATGWGTCSQTIADGTLRGEVLIKWGKLRLRTIAVAIPSGKKVAGVDVVAAGKKVAAKLSTFDNRVTIALEADIEPAIDESVRFEVTFA